jgi:hypothetical protein
MTAVVASCAFIVASGIAVTWWVPQLVRLMRVGNSGVSSGTWALYAASAGVWAVWALLSGSWLFGIVQSVETVGILAVVVVLRAWRLFLLLTAAMGVFLLLALAGGSVLVGVVGIAVTAGSRFPQIRKSVLSPDVRGVSAWSWTIGLIGNVSWIIWSVVNDMWLFALTCLTAVLASMVIIAATQVRTWRAAPRGGDDAVTL